MPPHAGATRLIVSDVPAGQRPELRRIHLVAPTSTDERIRVAASTTDGWLYLVTRHRDDGRTRRALVRARGARRADAGDRRRASPSTRASASRRPSRRLPRRRSRTASSSAPAPSRSRRTARRRSARTSRRCAAPRRPQWLTRTRLPQREHRARRCVRKNRFASGTRWPSSRQRYRLTPPGRPGRASSRCSRPRACR